MATEIDDGVNENAPISQASSLLRLPPEIRQEILWHVLGGDSIHFEYPFHKKWSAKRAEGVMKFEEEERWMEVKSLSNEIDFENYVDSTHYHQARSENRWPRPLLPIDFGDQKFYLSVLKTCRQLHDDGFNVLWRTNTFTFSNALSLKHFLMCLTPTQAGQIRTLCLDFDWDVFDFEDFNSHETAVELLRLQGLQNLWLSLDLRVDPAPSTEKEYLKYTGGNKFAESILPEMLIESPVFSILKALPKEKAEVKLKYSRCQSYFWNFPTVDIGPVAERLKRALLDDMAKRIPEKERISEIN